LFIERVGMKVGRQLSGSQKPDQKDEIEIDIPDSVKNLLEEYCYF